MARRTHGTVLLRTGNEQLAAPRQRQVICFEYFACKLFEIKILKWGDPLNLLLPRFCAEGRGEGGTP